MTNSIYAASFDPITNGHLDIITRAARDFENVTALIGINPKKNYLFSLDERRELVKKSTAHLKNIDVISFDGLLVDYAYENDIGVIVKGIRNNTDTDYEQILHEVGRSQKLGIETYILFAKPELTHVSSSAVKEIQTHHGDIHEYVPLCVKQALEEKISGQYMLGITGEIGVGKSYISNKFLELGKKNNIQTHTIEMDKIGHSILSDLKEPRYAIVRNELTEEFGDIKLPDGKIDRKKLGDIVFNDENKLKKLNQIMYEPMMVRMRKELSGKTGLILLDAAIITESNMTYITNNNVLFIYADKDTQRDRLIKNRKMTEEQIERRANSQFSYDNKKQHLLDSIKKDNNGQIWTIDNSQNANPDNVEHMYMQIISDLDIKIK